MTPEFLEIQRFEDLRPLDQLDETGAWIRGMFWSRLGPRVVDTELEVGTFKMVEARCIHGHLLEIPIWEKSERKAVREDHFPLRVVRGLFPPFNGTSLEEVENFRLAHSSMMDRVIADTYDLTKIIAVWVRDDLNVVLYDADGVRGND